MSGRMVGRITNRAAFAELQRSRSRGASGPVRAVFVQGENGASGEFPQVGYAIGRRCGGAVARNSIRRRAREVARAEAPTLPRGCYLLRFEPGVERLEPAQFRKNVATALQRAGRAAMSA